MVKGGGDMVVPWTWRLCNMAFESGVLSEDNYRGINLLRVVGKIYAGISVEKSIE